MKLYKYRSLQNIEFTLDILINQRLYCAQFETLNDPFEGLYFRTLPSGYYAAGQGFVKFKNAVLPRLTSIGEIIAVNDGNLVCSLSANASDVRMWAHYADSHKGIAIEIDTLDERVFPVEYVTELSQFSNAILGGAKASDVLSKKSHHWAYEEEFRIISSDAYFPIEGKITGLYFGRRTPEILKKVILKLCPDTLPVYTTKLEEKTLDIVIDERIER